MMYRYAGYLKADTGRKADLSKFADAKSVSLFAKDAMQWAVGNGIITGKLQEKLLDPGTLQPAQNVRLLFRDLWNCM